MQHITRPLPLRDVAIGVVWHDRKVLLVQRQQNAPLGGQWEFPGGKLEAGETPEGALRRELREEVGVCIAGCAGLGVFLHDYGHISVRLHAFASTVLHPAIVLCGPAAYRWCTLPALRSVPLLAGSQEVVSRLQLAGAW